MAGAGGKAPAATKKSLKKLSPPETIRSFLEDSRMDPLNYFEQIIRMPDKADKFELRLRMVNCAMVIGVKPTAGLFRTTPKTVRKWLKRYHQERLSGLNELPRIPEHCPHKTSPALERKVVELRKRYTFMGAEMLKREHSLPCSHSAIGRILREHNLIQKRRPKHKRKKDLSEIKKRWKLFGQITVGSGYRRTENGRETRDEPLATN
jgi:transposase